MFELLPTVIAGLTGFVFGVLLSIPVGPVNLTIMNEGARRGFFWAIMIGLGASVNGAVRQEGSTSDMVFGVAALISYVSQILTLEAGDLIATGTPAGVGPLVHGDVVVVWVEGIGQLTNRVVNRDDR